MLTYSVDRSKEFPAQVLYEFDDIERDNKERVDAAKEEIRRNEKDTITAEVLEEDLQDLKLEVKPGYLRTNNTGLLCRPEVITHTRFWSFWASYKETPKSVECMYTGYNRDLPLEF
jgi:hypothetical protein